jgi:hypothetical protein
MVCPAGKIGDFMETVEKLKAKGPKRPTRCIRMTQRTVSSTATPLVFARISCFGGNPVKYTDPDGKMPMSFTNDGKNYHFSPSYDTIENGVNVIISSFVPFVGDQVEGIGKGLAGYREIKSDDSNINSLDIISFINDVISQSSNIFDYKSLKVAGKIAGFLNIGITILKVHEEISAAESVLIDNLVQTLVGPQLSGKSHNEVAYLYRYARGRIESLVESGDISYTYNKWRGTVKDFNVDGEVWNSLENELIFLQKILNKIDE